MRKTFTTIGAQRLEEYLQKNDFISNSGAAKFLGVSNTCSLYILEYMEAIGKVGRKKMNGRYTFYLKEEDE